MYQMKSFYLRIIISILFFNFIIVADSQTFYYYHDRLGNILYPVKANPDMLDAIYWKNKVL